MKHSNTSTRNNKYCPECGTRLVEPRDLKELWITFYSCQTCSGRYYLDVGDMKWIYPLMELDHGVGRKLISCDFELISQAVKLIKQIDYKTVSIIGFEAVINGRPEYTFPYEITYK